MLFTLHFHFAGFEASIFPRISVSACFIHWQSSCFAKQKVSSAQWRRLECRPRPLLEPIAVEIRHVFVPKNHGERNRRKPGAVFLRSMSEISEVRSLYPPCHPCRPLSSPACRSRRYDSDQQIHRRRFPSVARLLLSLAKLNALQGDQPAPVLTKVQTTDKKHMKKNIVKTSKGFQA